MKAIEKNPRRNSTGMQKAGWRAAYARHSLHIARDSSVLIAGRGAAALAEHLESALKGRVAITVNASIGEQPEQRYDYLIGVISAGERISPTLAASSSAALGEGGAMLLFCPRGADIERQLRACTELEEWHMSYYDVIPDWLPGWIAASCHKFAFLLEQSPLGPLLTREEAYIAHKRGMPVAHPPLADREELRQRVSVVVPCHNESMNIERIADRVLHFYGDYICELIFVDDNSRDNTAEVITRCSQRDNRIKLVKRAPPNGVGRALRDGYRAATGDYILSMDCDFVEMLPELSDVFDAVADGRDGAIGSRFSYQSVMAGYPFSKMLCNRIFHLLLRMLARKKMHDITNNLKLYRAEILRTLEIESPHFSANLETGLKPLLKGYDIVEVPVSWINRRAGMGQSSFRTLRVGPPYVVALVKSVFKLKRAAAG